jgi:hypothetical protein
MQVRDYWLPGSWHWRVVYGKNTILGSGRFGKAPDYHGFMFRLPGGWVTMFFFTYGRDAVFPDREPVPPTPPRPDHVGPPE